MSSLKLIKVSAPCKVHLLGEHAVVYGKPALLVTVDLRIYVTIVPADKTVKDETWPVREIIEPIIKNKFGLKKIPDYKLEISSEIPIGSGLGSSAAVSAATIGALLLFLKVNWDLQLINDLTYEAEKVFHGNPSGADNSTIIFGGLIWYRKETPGLKIIQKLNFTIDKTIAKNFILINTGKPNETTKQMVESVKKLYEKKPSLVNNFLESQEQLTKQLLIALQGSDEKEVMRIINKGERNLEKISVVSDPSQKIIREIEKLGGVAKICGAGGTTKATGILLAYHQDKKVVEKIAQEYNLAFFNTNLGVEGLRIE